MQLYLIQISMSANKTMEDVLTLAKTLLVVTDVTVQPVIS